MVEELYQSFRCITGLGDDVCGSCVGAVDIRRRDRSSTVGHSLDVCRGDGPHDGVSGGRRGGLTVATGCLHVGAVVRSILGLHVFPLIDCGPRMVSATVGAGYRIGQRQFRPSRCRGCPCRRGNAETLGVHRHGRDADDRRCRHTGPGDFSFPPHWLEKERRAGLAASREEISAPSVTTAQAVRTHAFWQVWAIWFAGGGAAITMMTFAATYSAHLNDIGVRVSAVAAVTAFVSGNGLIRVINAMVLDRVGPTVIGAVTSLTLAMGYVLLGFVTSGWALIVVALLAGVALGTIFTISPLLLTPLFGLKHFGPIFGLAFTAYGVFGAFAGPMLSSYLAQQLGYALVFVYLAVLMVWAFLSVLAVNRSRRRMTAHWV